MREFIAQYCHKNDKKVNMDMLHRSYDKPIYEYIVDTCKNLEVIPGLTLESWELITDQTKIHSVINKRTVKDPKIKNNKTLERLAQPNRTLYDLLVLNFHVQVKDADLHIQRRVRVLKPIRGGMYIRNGKKVRLLNQVVDNSTFVKGNVLNFKTKLYPIKLSTIKAKIKFTNGEISTCPCYQLDLLSKVTNPLIYYLAQYGLEGTIRKMCLENVMSVVDAPLDSKNYLYTEVTPGVYLEIHQKAFYKNETVAALYATMAEVLKADKAMTLKDAYNKEYWMERLSEIFSKKRSANKALRVLVSFNKIMDISVKKQLKLPKHHKKNTFTIIMWMMTNFLDLLKKDSHDLKYKRVRANEVPAYFFDKHISKNVYSLLNTDNPPVEKYIRLLNSINEMSFLKGASGGGKCGKSGTNSMFRYERYNDFDAIEISRYTLKGPTGLNGGKQGVSSAYRDIYPSHFGRYDVNVCSSSDPGLTGYLCANVQIDPNGYFDPDFNEPDSYEPNIDAFLDSFADPNYVRKREEYVKMQLSRDKDGFVVLKRIYTVEEMQKMFLREPEKYGLYRTEDGLRLIPKHERDPKGFVVLRERRAPVKEAPKEERDADGFYVLRPVVTKMSKRMAEAKLAKRKKK